MFTTSSTHVLSHASGKDNNCFFASYSLGISQPHVLDQMEAEHAIAGLDINDELGFVVTVANALRVEKTWKAVKARLKPLHENNKDQLQATLAPAFRSRAYFLALKDKQHFQKTTRLLTSAFHNAIYKRIGIAERIIEDDIVTQHKFIVKKFRELLSKFGKNLQKAFTEKRFSLSEFKKLKTQSERTIAENQRFKELEAELNATLDPIETELLIWWHGPSGYKRFLTEMNHPGRVAGDLEGELLAAKDHVNLVVDRGGSQPYTVHFDCGAIAIADATFGYALDANVVNQLVTRKIVDKPEDEDATELKLFPLDETVLAARLSSVKDVIKVARFIAGKGDSLKNTPVPKEFSVECVAELKHRDVVRNKDGKLFFAVSEDVANERIVAVKHAAKIQAAYQKNRKTLPVLRVQHLPESNHYNALLEKVEPKATVATPPAKSKITSSSVTTTVKTSVASPIAPAKAAVVTPAVSSLIAPTKKARPATSPLVRNTTSVVAPASTSPLPKTLVTTNTKPVITSLFHEKKEIKKAIKKVTTDTLDLERKDFITKANNDEKHLIKEAEKAKKAGEPAPGIYYTVSDKSTIFVSKKMQEALDENLAKKLQREEYNDYKSTKLSK